PDALLEVWQPDARGQYPIAANGEPIGFGRCRTDAEGAFNFVTIKPGPSSAPDGRLQAPHLNVTVFARGLLRHLVTRMYFPDEAAANSADPVRVDEFAVAQLGKAAVRSANPVIPLVNALRAAVPKDAAPFVHRGATSQDVLDTAMMLIARRGLELIIADLGRAAATAASLA